MEAEGEVQRTRQQGLIARLLAQAVKVWLRSQLEGLTELHLQIDSGDRQLLCGSLPQVQLAAEKAIYKGVHLSSIRLQGQDIRINLGQVLKGQPLQLLHPIPIELAVVLRRGDLQASLPSLLLQAALMDAIQRLMGPQLVMALGPAASGAWTLARPQLELEPHRLTFSAILITQTGRWPKAGRRPSLPLTLQTGLSIGQPGELVLYQPQWRPTALTESDHPFLRLPDYTFALGDQVNLQELVVMAEAIVCRGQLLIVP